MLEPQNALMEVLQQLGFLEIAALLAAVVLLAIWLLFRVKQRKSEQAVAVEKTKDFAEPAPAPAPAPQAQVNKSSSIEKTAAAATASSSQAPAVSTMPEDSVLRRHYLATQAAQRLAVSEPYPTDSVLHRHHDAIHTLHLDDKPAAAVAPVVVKVGVDARPKLPQDSVLKRHFIAQLQAEVEACIAPRPSDSVLLRHHRALAAAELEKRLSAFSS